MIMLDPFLEQIMIIGLSGLVVVMGGVIGLKWVSLHSLDKNFVTNKVKQYKDLSEEYKKEASRLRGKMGKDFQRLQVDGSYDLNDTDDLGQIAKTVLPNILEFLPADIQDKAKGFLNNPDMVNMAVELYKKHPEQIKSLLAKFVKGGSTKQTSDNSLKLDPEETNINYA